MAGRWSGRGVWSLLMTESYAECGPNLCGGPGTYHPIVIRRLLTRYRRGNPLQSIWLGALLASPVWVNTLVYRPTSSAGTLLLLGGSLAGGYVIARVFLGSVSADLEEVRAQNLWLQERAQRADAAFAAHPISVAVCRRGVRGHRRGRAGGAAALDRPGDHAAKRGHHRRGGAGRRAARVRRLPVADAAAAT